MVDLQGKINKWAQIRRFVFLKRGFESKYRLRAKKGARVFYGCSFFTKNSLIEAKSVTHSDTGIAPKDGSLGVINS